MAFLPLIALAGNDQIRYEGTMMIFPTKENVIDLDLDLFDFDFSNIPQEFSPMVGKVYRGSIVAYSGAFRVIVYFFLTGYDQKKDCLEFAFARSSFEYSKSQVFGLSCPQSGELKSMFSCDKQFKGWKVRDLATFKFYFEEKPILLFSGGCGVYNFEEAGTLPENLMRK